MSEPRGPQRWGEGGADGRQEQRAAELLGQLPAFGSDQVARERVWRELGGRLPGPRRRYRARWGWVAVAAVAASVAAVALVPLRAGRRFASARLELASGNVLSATPENGWIPVKTGGTLTEASRLQTDVLGRAVVSLSRSAVLVGSKTDLGLESLRDDTFLRLTGGRVSAEVDHRRPGETFVVQTTRYRVEVRGTIFSVEERSADDVSVAVSRGLVRVTGEGGSWDVPAGRSWSSRETSQDNAASGVAITPADEALLDAALRRPDPSVLERLLPGEQPAAVAPASRGSDERAPSAASPAAVAEPPIAAAAARAPVVPPPAVVPPVAAKPAVAHAPRLTPPVVLARLETPVRADPGTEAAASAAPPSTALPAATPPATAPSPAVAPPPPPVRSEAYADALALARAGLFSEAEAALVDLVRTRDRNADVALYDLARLRQEHLGNAPGALAALMHYEEAFPRGPLVQEVELSAIELTLAQSDLPAALSQMNRFLREHPQSERAAEVHLLRGNLLRGRGDCADALRDYGEIRDGASSDDGLYYRAFCEQATRDEAAAAGSLRKYLVRFPSGRHAGEVRTALGSR